MGAHAPRGGSGRSLFRRMQFPQELVGFEPTTSSMALEFTKKYRTDGKGFKVGQVGKNH
jgi:hypothetical protein